MLALNEVEIISDNSRYFIQMRRTPYSERTKPTKSSKLSKVNVPLDSFSRTQKSGLTPMKGERLGLSYYHFHREEIPKRPPTTNRTYSFTQTQSKYSDIKDRATKPSESEISRPKISRNEHWALRWIRKIINCGFQTRKKLIRKSPYQGKPNTFEESFTEEAHGNFNRQ